MMNTINTWDKAQKLADKHSNSGGTFIRLANNGDKVVGAFCGEPFAREVVWVGDKYEDFDPAIHTEKRPTLRVMLNFFVPELGEMKVIEGGTVWFKDLLKLRDKYGLAKWFFEIERHGDAGDSKTNYSILPEEKIDEATRACIAETELHDLAAIAGVGGAQKGGNEKPTANERAESTGPIDPRVAGDLVAQLKSLPREEVDAFLSEFGVQRVRDLKASQEKDARTFIKARLDAVTQPAEIDPFA